MSEKRVDESWKQQAQQEKEKVAGTSPPPGPPPAEFTTLVASLATQALLALGVLGERDKASPPDLVEARFAIDLLGVLETKTRGNLTPEEERHLAAVLTELRLAFVEASRRPAPASPTGPDMPKA